MELALLPLECSTDQLESMNCGEMGGNRERGIEQILERTSIVL